MQCAKAAPAAKELRRQAGTWLKQLRGRAGLSQLQLAERLNLKYYTFVSQVENGFGRVPTESMEAWARAWRRAASLRAPIALVLRSRASSAAVRGRAMTVIGFPPKGSRARGAWQPAELDQIVGALVPERCHASAGRWDVGVTEMGDPQFYLLGPPPHDECMLCISRLGPLYVLEDGAGQVLLEHNSLVVLAEQAKSILQKKKAQIVARAALIWCAVRETFEEKLEVMVGEGEELLTHFAPQLAAFA